MMRKCLGSGTKELCLVDMSISDLYYRTMIKSTDDSTFPEAALLVGRKVLTGSPGYEVLEEAIMTVRETDVYGADGLRIRIEFDSGFFTNMSPGDFRHFVKHGSADFERWFGSKHDKGLETIELV